MRFGLVKRKSPDLRNFYPKKFNYSYKLKNNANKYNILIGGKGNNLPAYDFRIS